MTAYIAGYILQIVGAVALCYIIARLQINAYIIYLRKKAGRRKARRRVGYRIDSKQSVIDVMEEEA